MSSSEGYEGGEGGRGEWETNWNVLQVLAGSYIPKSEYIVVWREIAYILYYLGSLLLLWNKYRVEIWMYYLLSIARRPTVWPYILGIRRYGFWREKKNWGRGSGIATYSCKQLISTLSIVEFYHYKVICCTVCLFNISVTFVMIPGFPYGVEFWQGWETYIFWREHKPRFPL